MDDLLGRIQGPQDIKQLSPEELKHLCEEIRREIIAVVS